MHGTCQRLATNTRREGVPRAVNSSPPLACRPSAETGEGRPLGGEGEVGLAGWSWSSGSTASLLGAGVREELDLSSPCLKSLAAEGSGVGAADGRTGEEADGVRWKKPSRVFCPPEELLFLRAGVEAGVAAVFLAMLDQSEHSYATFAYRLLVGGQETTRTG